ncbi:T9SS type A sorting domain-containing protein [Dysgonomonas sp.]|jgi:type 1 fimbria pilin
MGKFKYILFLILFTGISFQANSKGVDFPVNGFSITDQPLDNTTTLEVNINNTTKIKMENVPTSGYLEVYSILGVKVTSINLKTCAGSCSLDLTKGLYILKAGKSAQKVIVR